MSLATSARINISVDRAKYPKVFEALSTWKQDRYNISSKVCTAIERLYQEEKKEEQLQQQGQQQQETNKQQ